MTESIPPSSKAPGIVIFVAVLNFIWAVFFLMAAFFCALGLFFGGAFGMMDRVSQQMTTYAANANLSFGVSSIFIFLFVVSLVSFALFLSIGVGLLRGRALAWYFQIAMSTIGLAGFPIGTVLNAVILVFFFQGTVREYFRV